MPETLPSGEKGAGARIAFLFKGGREDRRSGSFPTEFFYGLIQLQQAGYPAEILTDRQLGVDNPPNRFWRAFSQLVYITAGIPWWPLLRLARRTVRDRLNSYDYLVVTTNTFGLCLGVLRRFGLIRARILFIAIGLIETRTPIRIVLVYRWFLGKGVAVCALSEAEAGVLTQRLRMPVAHIPFGVDASFWVPGRPDTRLESGDYVLSIGNDRHRDYRTLMDAWKPHYPLLRIITRLDIASTARNIEILRGDWHSQILDDVQIRTLMQNARFVILPIRQTIQPSGQSACLQAMACAKTVVITDFSGLWNRKMLRDGATCILAGPPGFRAGIQAAAERLLADPGLVIKVGQNARKMVESELDVTRMASAIAAELQLSGNRQHELAARLKHPWLQ
jgi:glycosyltransferase involved in cell wall biosynthesis